MKVVRAVDDLDFAESGTETVATQTRRLVLDGRAVELDLSDEHAEALDKMIAPYLAVGHAPSAGSPAVRAPRRSPTRGRKYFRALRAWADQQDPPMSYRTQVNGHFYYSLTLRRAFEDAGAPGSPGGVVDE